MRHHWVTAVVALYLAWLIGLACGVVIAVRYMGPGIVHVKPVPTPVMMPALPAPFPVPRYIPSHCDGPPVCAA